MSANLEQIVNFSAMSILVTLFTWIYFRDRQQRIGLWMAGWVAIFIHFAAELAWSLSLISRQWFFFFKVSTLLVAGISFMLSVSAVYTTPKKRLLFLLMVGVPSISYVACLIWASRLGWIFPASLLLSILAGFVNACVHYGRKSLYLYGFSLVLLPYGTWAVWQALKHNPGPGLIFLLSMLFGVTGALYWRHFHLRFTPGVVTTSLSFLAWGLVFPLGYVLGLLHVGPPVSSPIWDLPKYFVAFGMILTLFENQAVLATAAARQYQVLFEGNMAGVYVATVEGQVLDCNAAFVKMYGFHSKQELLQLNSDAFFCADPADRRHFFDDLKRDGMVINHECRKIKKDGAQLWVLERATIFNDSSGRKLIECTAIDITERKQAELALKQSEERFSTIFRNSPIGCGIVSLEGVFVDVNDALLKLFGLPPEQVIGKTGVELGLWKSQTERDLFYRRLRAEGAIKGMEIEFKDSSGGRHIGLYFGTLVNLNGKDCIFGMQLDCTEQRDLEARFLQAQKMEALGRLAGGVAHDFNNLMGIIGGYGELLQVRLHDEKLRQYCNRILETTQRAGALTNKLLTFSRKEIIRPAPLKADVALRELASILPRLIGEDIELDLELRAGGIIVIDKTHFEQIIFNIVVNARDAMPNGGHLRIETWDETGGAHLSSSNGNIGPHVVIRISDTGIGMDHEIQSRAFEPFFTTKDMGRGTGLGLSTVYGIVQQCGGDISLESQPGKGTQITIVLPAIEHVEIPECLESILETQRGSGHILLVEDEAELRNANAEFLTSIGYSVTCAAGGAEALELARKASHIDLVISDVVMPRMNGREFTDRLLKIYPDVKVLFVSGYADDVVLQAGISRLGTPFLQKPYTLKVLAAKVQEVLSADTREPLNDPRPANGDD